MKSVLSVITMFVGGLFFFANAGENLLKNADPSNEKTAWINVTVESGAGKQGNACFKQQNRYIYYKELIKIDVAKSYKLSGWIKNPTEKELRVLFGIQLYDQDNRKIDEPEVFFEAGTETELTAESLATDTVIKVKDASKWKFGDTYPVRLIAFKTEADYKDLPNRNLSSPGIDKIEKKDDHWEITLKGPAMCAFPAGTSVREHKIISPPTYTADEKIAPGTDWRELTGSAFKKWYPGTVYCKIVIVVQGGNGLLFENIKLETVE